RGLIMIQTPLARAHRNRRALTWAPWGSDAANGIPKALCRGIFAMRAPAVVVVCLGGVLMTGCGFAEKPKPSVDTAKIIDAIKTDEVHWNADWRSGDAAKLAAHYAPEA